jgi:hypothetical protein
MELNSKSLSTSELIYHGIQYGGQCRTIYSGGTPKLVRLDEVILKASHHKFLKTVSNNLSVLSNYTRLFTHLIFTSTHWSCDGFAFQKSSTRVVRIQSSDHVIRETNWVTAGPGDSETKFKRRTITSSQMEDITLVHYLGEVGEGIRISREIDLEDED